MRKLGSHGAVRPPQPRRLRTFRAPSRYARYSRYTQKLPVRFMRYMRYTAYLCMYEYGRRQKGAEIPLMVRFCKKSIPYGSAGGVPQLLGGV